MKINMTFDDIISCSKENFMNWDDTEIKSYYLLLLINQITLNQNIYTPTPHVFVLKIRHLLLISLKWMLIKLGVNIRVYDDW